MSTGSPKESSPSGTPPSTHIADKPTSTPHFVARLLWTFNLLNKWNFIIRPPTRVVPPIAMVLTKLLTPHQMLSSQVGLATSAHFHVGSSPPSSSSHPRRGAKKQLGNVFPNFGGQNPFLAQDGLYTKQRAPGHPF